MSIEAMKQAREVIRIAQNNLAPSKGSAHSYGDGELWDSYDNAMNGLDQAIARAEHLEAAVAERSAEQHKKQCTHRLVDVTNPVVKSGYMCMDCGALFGSYIQKPEAEKQEIVAEMMKNPSNGNLYVQYTKPLHLIGAGAKFYTSPPQRQPLYPREVKDVLRATGYVTNSQAWELAEEVMKLLAAHGIKGEA